MRPDGGGAIDNLVFDFGRRDGRVTYNANPPGPVACPHLLRRGK